KGRGRIWREFPPPPISSPSPREGEDLRKVSSLFQRERGFEEDILILKEGVGINKDFLLFSKGKGRIKEGFRCFLLLPEGGGGLRRGRGSLFEAPNFRFQVFLRLVF
ncbi:MAG: hypothetical protein B5M48_04000, partial [Candidatus Omnitrophica bacterium 4484_213]